MDGKWNAAADRLTHVAQLADGSQPDESTNGHDRDDWQQVLSHRPLTVSLSLCEETGSYPGLSFILLPRLTALERSLDSGKRVGFQSAVARIADPANLQK